MSGCAVALDGPRPLARFEFRRLVALPDLTTRTLALILIETGLRAIDARTLPVDCLSSDAAGAPYLRYFNHKAGARAVPADQPQAGRAAASAAASRPRAVPDGEACLLPRERHNADGRHPYAYHTLVERLHTWVAKLDVRDPNRLPVAVTPHRFRHTLATRIVNAGVAEIAVQQMLDHDSPQMTSVYARLHDQTLRALRPLPTAGQRARNRSPPRPTTRSPMPPGPSTTSPAPSRRSRKGSAGCRCSRPARTPTRA